MTDPSNSKNVVGSGSSKAPSLLPRRCNSLWNFPKMDINIDFETIFQAIRWCIFLLLGCRKFGLPCEGLHAISVTGASFEVCVPIWALSGPNMMNSSLVLVCRSNYDLFHISSFLGGRRTPPPNLWRYSSVGCTRSPLLGAFNCRVLLLRRFHGQGYFQFEFTMS